MNPGYPVVLDLTGRRCVVVGAGGVASRRVFGLLPTGASVVVVAPDVSADIATAAEAGRIQLQQRRFEPSDLDGAFLTMAATDNPDVNRTVAEAAHRRGVLVTMADDSAPSDFSVPALVRRDGITLTVSTGGRSPAFARHLREQLEGWLTPERCALLDLLSDLRRELLASGQQFSPTAWNRAISDPVISAAIVADDLTAARRLLLSVLTDNRHDMDGSQV